MRMCFSKALVVARFAIASLLIGCGGEGGSTGSGGGGAAGSAGGGGGGEGCLPPNRLVGELCLSPGVQDDGCPAGEVGLEAGSCRPAGVPPELCAEGFVHDGDAACEPILPEQDCPSGQMAIPGETACRPVMDCGSGTWGDIPVDGATVYVDQSANGNGDGSEAQPFTTINEGIAAASEGGLVAVAAGTYAEDILLDEPVRLWGVCPDLVTVAGEGDILSALAIVSGADGSEVVGLAVSSEINPVNVIVQSAEDITFDRLWVHDGAGRGFNVEADAGPTSLTIRRTLVERTRTSGIFLQGATITLEESVVRDTLPRASDDFSGRGIALQPDPTTGAPSIATLTASLVDGNHDIGVYVSGSEASLEGVVVRDTLPRASDQGGGRGIAIRDNDAVPSTLVVSGSLVAHNHDVGVFVQGSEASLEGVVIRETQPNQASQNIGRGINVQTNPTTGNASNLTLASCLVERSHEVGILVGGSEASLEGVLVRDTLPRESDQNDGTGISIQDAVGTGAPSTATLLGTRVARSYGVGIAVASSAAELTGVIVHDTQPRQIDGLLGDGFAVVNELAPASGVFTACTSEDNVRAGLSSFGSDVTVGNTRLRCNGFDLAGEPNFGLPFAFTDQGGNLCGCEEATVECKAISAGLEPPGAVGDGP